MAFENLKSTGIAYLLTKLKGVFVQISDSVRSVNHEKPDEYGNIDINSVPYAQQLESSSTQRNYGVFTQRTTGGASSIETGNAWLMAIHGSNTHTGVVEEELDMTVTSSTITATIDRDTFVAAVSASGTTTLTYTSSWSENPATYGVAVTGTPTSGDTIVIEYTKAERGTITVSNPQTFVSTGWNLYSNTTGYAKVVGYDYGYGISGTYSALQYSATLTGDRSDITVTNGTFDVPGDGYVWVTAGSTDTAIWATWEDWEEGYDGNFASYTTSVVDFSTIMSSRFPYGLMKAGSVYDEIDFNLKKAINRVERMAYSTSNLATARASGREYEYDESYIYIALATPVENDITQDGGYQANDHGIEYFTGSDIDVNAEILYGQNLRNKLERDTLTISSQSLTTTQKAQVNTNIGSIPKRIPAYSGDLNDIAETGLVYATDSATNCPQGWGIVETLFYDNNAITQVCTNVINGKRYVRHKSNVLATEWSSWELVHYGSAVDLGTISDYDDFKSALTALTGTMNVKEEKTVGFGCQFAAGGFKNGITYQGTLRVVAKNTNSMYYTVLFEGAATSTTIPVYLMYNNGTFNVYPILTRSFTFNPSNGDSLLTWLLNYVNADTLPFSFQKAGFNNCSDTPSGLDNKEFSGVVIGAGDRMKVMLKQYGGDSSPKDFDRDLWQGAWNGGWTSSHDTIIGIINDAIVVEEYTFSYTNFADGDYKAVSASDFGITEKQGYTMAGIVGYATGSYNVYAYGVLPRTSGTIMSLRNKSGVDISATVTCRVTVLWVKDAFM